VTPDEQIADDLANFYADPLGHVMYSYPWDTEPAIQMVKLPKRYQGRFDSVWGPDEWACEFLDDLGFEIATRGFDGRNAVEPIRYATVSGHGIGKSVIASWLIKFIMDTRPRSKGTVTAGTDNQLRTKTWAELGKWNKMSATGHWFDYNTGRGSMSLTHKRFKEDWRCDAQTSREENSENFAGQHAAGGTSFYVFDEASAVPDSIYKVRNGGLTDGEPMVFDFGNGTRNSGQFYEECEGTLKHRYRTNHIDSRSVQITNKAYLQELIDDFGLDSDIVKVRVRGMFPSSSSMQYMPTADVLGAMDRPLVTDRFAPLVIGVDVARFGDDDTVIYPRVGLDCRSYFSREKCVFNGLTGPQIADKIIKLQEEFRDMGMECAGLFVDGGSIGASVVDHLGFLGVDHVDVNFGEMSAEREFRYVSDQMWGTLKKQLPRIMLPHELTDEGKELKDQLTQREYGITLGNKIHLESKKDMKARGIGSPDWADALALTFRSPVRPRSNPAGAQAKPKEATHEYDPFDGKER